MPRPKDEPVPADEELYRGIAFDWVSPDGALLADAIDTRGSSCARAKYGKPEDAKRGARNGVASTTAAKLPGPQTFNGVQYECFVVDEPDEGDHHAEIRARRTADRETSRENRFPKSAAARDELKALLARSFTVIEKPTKATPPEGEVRGGNQS